MVIENSKIERTKVVLNEIFSDLIKNKVSNFEVASEDLLPYGLKPHTRSICWIAEQVLTQNIKKNQHDYQITDFEFPMSDISPWDAKFKLKKSGHDADIFINLKVTNIANAVRNNDLVSVKSLINFYKNNKNPLLFYVVIGLKFDKNKIIFCGEPISQYYPWISEFVINKRNKHLQSKYGVKTKHQSISDFLDAVKRKSLEKEINFD